MATENLYAPPGAMVGDVYATTEVQPVKLWPPSGRIGRVRMLAYGMALYLVFFVALLVTGIVVAMLPKSAGGAIGVILFGVAYLVYVVAGVAVMIQRSHDMDLSGWSVLLLLIPFVIFYWLFKSGTPGVNRFGAPPPPNTVGVKVLAWCLLIVPFAFGILAAIAIPAYQQYTERARARTSQQPPP